MPSHGRYHRNIFRERKRYQSALLQRSDLDHPTYIVDADFRDWADIILRKQQRSIKDLTDVLDGNGVPQPNLPVMGDSWAFIGVASNDADILDRNFGLSGQQSRDIGIPNSPEHCAVGYVGGLRTTLFDDTDFRCLQGGSFNLESADEIHRRFTNIDGTTLVDDRASWTPGFFTDLNPKATVRLWSGEYEIQGNTRTTLTLNAAPNVANDMPLPHLDRFYNINLRRNVAVEDVGVYIDVHIEDWGASEDPELDHNPGGTPLEAMRRNKLIQQVWLSFDDSAALGRTSQPIVDYTDHGGVRHYVRKIGTLRINPGNDPVPGGGNGGVPDGNGNIVDIDDSEDDREADQIGAGGVPYYKFGCYSSAGPSGRTPKLVLDSGLAPADRAGKLDANGATVDLQDWFKDAQGFSTLSEQPENISERIERDRSWAVVGPATGDAGDEFTNDVKWRGKYSGAQGLFDAMQCPDVQTIYVRRGYYFIRDIKETDDFRNREGRPLVGAFNITKKLILENEAVLDLTPGLVLDRHVGAGANNMVAFTPRLMVSNHIIGGRIERRDPTVAGSSYKGWKDILDLLPTAAAYDVDPGNPAEGLISIPQYHNPWQSVGRIERCVISVTLNSSATQKTPAVAVSSWNVRDRATLGTPEGATGRRRAGDRLPHTTFYKQNFAAGLVDCSIYSENCPAIVGYVDAQGEPVGNPIDSRTGIEAQNSSVLPMTFDSNYIYTKSRQDVMPSVYLASGVINFTNNTLIGFGRILDVGHTKFDSSTDTPLDERLGSFSEGWRSHRSGERGQRRSVFDISGNTFVGLLYGSAAQLQVLFGAGWDKDGHGKVAHIDMSMVRISGGSTLFKDNYITAVNATLGELDHNSMPINLAISDLTGTSSGIDVTVSENVIDSCKHGIAAYTKSRRSVIKLLDNDIYEFQKLPYDATTIRVESSNRTYVTSGILTLNARGHLSRAPILIRGNSITMRSQKNAVGILSKGYSSVITNVVNFERVKVDFEGHLRYYDQAGASSINRPLTTAGTDNNGEVWAKPDPLYYGNVGISQSTWFESVPTPNGGVSGNLISGSNYGVTLGTNPGELWGGVNFSLASNLVDFYPTARPNQMYSQPRSPDENLRVLGGQNEDERTGYHSDCDGNLITNVDVGIYCQQSSPKIRDNTISDITFNAIYCAVDSTVVKPNAIISGNRISEAAQACTNRSREVEVQGENGTQKAYFIRSTRPGVRFVTGVGNAAVAYSDLAGQAGIDLNLSDLDRQATARNHLCAAIFVSGGGTISNNSIVTGGVGEGQDILPVATGIMLAGYGSITNNKVTGNVLANGIIAFPSWKNFAMGYTYNSEADFNFLSTIPGGSAQNIYLYQDRNVRISDNEINDPRLSGVIVGSTILGTDEFFQLNPADGNLNADQLNMVDYLLSLQTGAINLTPFNRVEVQDNLITARRLRDNGIFVNRSQQADVSKNTIECLNHNGAIALDELGGYYKYIGKFTDTNEQHGYSYGLYRTGSAIHMQFCVESTVKDNKVVTNPAPSTPAPSYPELTQPEVAVYEPVYLHVKGNMVKTWRGCALRVIGDLTGEVCGNYLRSKIQTKNSTDLYNIIAPTLCQLWSWRHSTALFQHIGGQAVAADMNFPDYDPDYGITSVLGDGVGQPLVRSLQVFQGVGGELTVSDNSIENGGLSVVRNEAQRRTDVNVRKGQFLIFPERNEWVKVSGNTISRGANLFALGRLIEISSNRVTLPAGSKANGYASVVETGSKGNVADANSCVTNSPIFVGDGNQRVWSVEKADGTNASLTRMDSIQRTIDKCRQVVIKDNVAYNVGKVGQQLINGEGETYADLDRFFGRAACIVAQVGDLSRVSGNTVGASRGTEYLIGGGNEIQNAPDIGTIGVLLGNVSMRSNAGSALPAGKKFYLGILEGHAEHTDVLYGRGSCGTGIKVSGNVFERGTKLVACLDYGTGINVRDNVFEFQSNVSDPYNPVGGMDMMGNISRAPVMFFHKHFDRPNFSMLDLQQWAIASETNDTNDPYRQLTYSLYHYPSQEIFNSNGGVYGDKGRTPGVVQFLNNQVGGYQTQEGHFDTHFNCDKNGYVGFIMTSFGRCMPHAYVGNYNKIPGGANSAQIADQRFYNIMLKPYALSHNWKGTWVNANPDRPLSLSDRGKGNENAGGGAGHYYIMTGTGDDHIWINGYRSDTCSSHFAINRDGLPYRPGNGGMEIRGLLAHPGEDPDNFGHITFHGSGAPVQGAGGEVLSVRPLDHLEIFNEFKYYGPSYPFTVRGAQYDTFWLGALDPTINIELDPQVPKGEISSYYAFYRPGLPIKARIFAYDGQNGPAGDKHYVYNLDEYYRAYPYTEAFGGDIGYGFSADQLDLDPNEDV